MNKITKTVVMASSILLLGTTANAYAAKALQGGYSHTSRYDVIETPAVDTKDRAYSLGFQKLEALKKLGSGRELSDTLGLYFLNTKEKTSTNLESGYVTVQEFMNEKGDIMYRGRVNVNYHFSDEVETR